MSDEIYFDGKRYISANDAASSADLTRDYVARLCRDGKISGRRVGKHWYIEQAPFQKFLVDQEYAKSRRSEFLGEQRSREYHNTTGVGFVQRRTPISAAPHVIKSSAFFIAEASHVPQLSSISGSRNIVQTELPVSTSHKRVETSLNISIPDTPSVISSRTHEIKNKMALAVLGQTREGFGQAKHLFNVPGGLAHAALTAAHIPVHTISPVTEFFHKVVALTLTFMLVFGTYAAVDPAYAQFAADSVREHVDDALFAYHNATGGGLNALAARTQTQVAAAAENPGVALASLQTLFTESIPNIAEHFARALNSNVNDVMYAIAFPLDLVSSRGIAARNERGSVSVSVVPYENATTSDIRGVATTQQQGGSVTQNIVNNPVVERVVQTTRLLGAGGISEELLDKKLAELENKLSSRILASSAANSTNITNIYAAAASVGRIEHLDGLDLTNPTLSGGRITGAHISSARSLSVDGDTSLATTTITGSLTVDGSVNLRNITLASSTLSISGVSGQTSNFLEVKDPSGTVLFAVQADGTLLTSNASSTSIYSSLLIAGGATTTNLFSTGFEAVNASTSRLTAVNATTTNATSTNLFATLGHFTTGLIDTLTSAAATITSLITTNATTTNATSTNLFSQTARFDSLALSNALSIASGGTATTTQVTNGVNFFDGSKITSGTALTFNGTTFGTPLFTATQTSGTSTIAAGQGFTIGGSQFLVQQGSGNVGIGTSTPGSIFSIQNVANFSTATSSLYSGLNVPTLNASGLSTLGNTIISNATSTNFFSTVASSTNLFAQTANLGVLNVSGVSNSLLYTSGNQVAAASVGSSLTFSAGSLALNTANPNSWTGLQQFANSSSTQSSVTQKAFFGLNGQSSFDFNGALSLSTPLGQTSGGTGISSYAAGDILYADGAGTLTRLPIGSTGNVLQVQAGLPAWGVNSGGGGGGPITDGLFATTTDSLLIYPSNTSRVVAIGTNATSTLNSIFEVSGQQYISSKLGIATTSPATTLSVGGSGYITGGLGVGVLNTSAGTLQTSGNATIGGTLLLPTLSTNSLLYNNGFNQVAAATVGSSLTFSAGALSLNTANSNTFSALQQFSNASSSLLSVFKKAYFGGTATSTFDSSGSLQVGTKLGVGTASTAFGIEVNNTGSGGYQLGRFNNDQVGNTSGGYIALATGGTDRGYLGVGKPSGGSTTLFTNELVNSVLLRSEGALHLGSGSTAGFTIDTSNRVGIGDTTPLSLFTVGSGDLFQVNSSGAIAAVTGITTSGGYTQSGSNANTFTGLSSFSNASTSLLSVFNKAYFGGTATSTFDSTGALNLVSALTYGGVTLSNAVTGTGNMVLSASPTLTGTLTAAAANFSGNVGIGTVSPSGKLSVISPDPSTNYLTLDLRNTNGYGIYAQENSITNRGNTLEFMATDYNSGSVTTRNLLALTPTGTVGVGTTTPWAKFAINNSTNDPAAQYLFAIASSTASATTTLFSVSNTGATSIYGGLTVNSSANSTFTGTGDVYLGNGALWSGLGGAPDLSVEGYINTDAGINTAGDVKIGHDAVLWTALGGSADLAVAGWVNANSGIITAQGSASSPGFNFYSTNNTGIFATGANSSAGIGFSTQGIERARIDQAGNLGIGTTTPFAQLQIAGSSALSTFKSQLTLTDTSGGTDAKHVSLASVNGEFRIGTTSDAYATSTLFSITNASTTVSKALYVSSAATSSFAQGLNLTSGCFSILGTCIGGSSGGGSSQWTTSGSNIYYSTGNVGIGTTTPWATLAVNPVAGGASNQFVVGSSTATAFIINNSGNIGVGSTTPWAKLSLKGTGTGGGVGFQVTNSANTPLFTTLDSGIVGIGTTTSLGTARLNLQANDNGVDVFNIFSEVGAPIFRFENAGSPLGGRFTIYDGSSNAKIQLSGLSSANSYFNSGGNVGIGTTTPFRKLSVTDTVATAQTAIAYDTTRYAEQRVDSNGDLNIGASGNDTFFNNDNLWVCTGGSFTVNGCPSGAPTGQGNLIVENKIGIGTTTPVANLHVQSVAAAGASEIRIDTSDWTSVPYLSFFTNSVATSSIQYRPDNPGLHFQTGGAAYPANTKLSILSSGKVGIGSTTPTTLLSVGGLLTVGANSTGAPATMGTATSTFNGDIKITGKLDVGTIDPVYSIDGVKYATYGHSTIGIHEETMQTIQLREKGADGKYVYTIDFDSLKKGSDMWLFYQVTDMGKDLGGLVVSLTPSFDGKVFYRKDAKNNRLIISGDSSGEVSMRLTAYRYDFSKWQNLRHDQDGDTSGSHVISSKPTPAVEGVDIVQQLTP